MVEKKKYIEENAFEKEISLAFGNEEQRTQASFNRWMRTEMKCKMYNVIYLWFKRKDAYFITATQLHNLLQYSRRYCQEFLEKLCEFGILHRGNDASISTNYYPNLERLNKWLEPVKEKLLKLNPEYYKIQKKINWNKCE